jgi:hypothetical protein
MKLKARWLIFGGAFVGANMGVENLWTVFGMSRIALWGGSVSRSTAQTWASFTGIIVLGTLLLIGSTLIYLLREWTGFAYRIPYRSGRKLSIRTHNPRSREDALGGCIFAGSLILAAVVASTMLWSLVHLNGWPLFIIPFIGTLFGVLAGFLVAVVRPHTSSTFWGAFLALLVTSVLSRYLIKLFGGVLHKSIGGAIVFTVLGVASTALIAIGLGLLFDIIARGLRAFRHRIA